MYDVIWKQILNIIQENLASNSLNKSFIQYFEDSKLIELTETKAVIITPFAFYRVILSNQTKMIEEAFKQLFNTDISCKIETSENYQRDIIKETIMEDLEDNVLPEFTFDNFIEGPSNKEAKMAAIACACRPGDKSYNPLVIYGNSGLGKTHLLNAIGNYIKENDPDKRLLYISSINFVKEVVKSINDNTIEDYKNRLNSVDVLLVDDIQALSGKSKTNEIFFDIYNELFNNRKQVVLTSDRLPSQIKDIEDRLKTRFSQGLSVTINSLEYETACKILELKLKNHNIDLNNIDKDVISFLATNFSSDVRNLEGSLNRLLFYSINFGKNGGFIDLPLCLEAFKGQNKIIVDTSKPLDFSTIIKAVADYYSLTKQQLVSKARTKNIANARHIAMYLCRKHLDASYDQIGDEFGGKDHTTVLSAYEKIDKLISTDDIYKKIIGDIEKNFIK